MRCLMFAEKTDCEGKIERHELWYGPDRQTAIKYNLRAPYCMKHHAECHENKKESQKHFCEVVGIEYGKVNYIMNRPPKMWDEGHQIFMNMIRDKIAPFLQRWNIKIKK